MIKSVELLDFQSHKKLRVQFAPGITTIIGDTDVGKSAVIRALRWVCQNVPQGADFVRWGSKCAVVTLEVEDQIIVRSRGKGENGYLMSGDEFKAFGTGVPVEIAKVLKLSDLNFQAQHDSPFWLSIGGTEVARQMNQIVNLEIIDGVLSAVADKTRKSKVASELSAQRRDEAKAKLEELAPILDADEALQVVERLENTWKQQAARAQWLEALVASLASLQAEAQLAARGKRRGEILVELAGAYLKAVGRTDELQSLVLTLEKAQKDINKGAIIAGDFKLLNASCADLRGLWRDRRDTKAAHEATYKELKVKVGGRCPICGEPIKL
jgi:exonuclease SbcC